jgi:hypothetical protein
MSVSTPPVMQTKTRRVSASVVVALIAWAAGTALIFPLSQGTLPFHFKIFDQRGEPFLGPILGAEGSLATALLIMAISAVVTLRRTVPDIAARAPERAIARNETLGMVVYAIVAQAGGYFLGHAIGHYAISLHMPGTLYGLSGPYTPREAIAWMLYNFIVYAVIPFVFFRLRGYSREQLNLTSVNIRADLVLIAVVLIVESAIELSTVSAAIFSLRGAQLFLGIPLAFGLNLFGTVLPIMIFIYAILLPRYLKLTGSWATTIILGGLTYAALHLFESWANYSTFTNGALSIIVLSLQYVGPGMVKSLLTLRTGNAWVHAWAYHAFEPHVTIDTPTIVQIFNIQP